MIDITSPDFLQNFKISDATIGQVGYGFIGNAVVELFKPFVKEVLVYDLKFTDQVSLGENVSAVPLESLLASAEVIFVALPTPMSSTGECHTGIVESALQQIQNTAVNIGRDLGSFIVVVKSTVPPGFTKRMDDKFALRLLFSPEFLTEKNAVEDFKRVNRVILGGDLEDARVVFKYFEGVWPGRMAESFNGHRDGPVHIIQCSSTVAEMVKLSTNAHLMARVILSNELYAICEKLGIDYSDVKKLTQCDPRIGLSHMDVPGPDGHMGAGGSCFPKDINNLRHVSKLLGTDEKLFTAIHERNIELRPERDWEQLKGRAVIDE